MCTEPDLQGFLNALERHLAEHERSERESGEKLKGELAEMFTVMELSVAAATLAVRVVEDRLKDGRDRRIAADFSAAGLAVNREIDLSRIFARLLDPSGAHAQGATFLALLVEELRLAPGNSGRLAAFRSPPGTGSRVSLEHPTGEITTPNGEKRSGSIDILVELADGRRIAIENKPWAGEQDKQIPRYLLYLQGLSAGRDTNDENVGNEKFVLLYWVGWTGDGSDPNLKPLEEGDSLRDRCIKMPYRETSNAPSVEGWLRRCAVACEAQRVRSFLIDLIRFVEGAFPR